MNKAFVLLAAAATLAGCSTDLEINAPYKESTVVYGLLNMRDTIHFVKINKAFLGEGDALVYANIPDSNEYKDEDFGYARVVRFQGATAMDTFPLRDTVLHNREPGTFFSPDQKMFYFRDNDTYNLPQSNVEVYLDQNSDYELQVEVKGNRITGRTTIVNDFSIQSVDQSMQQAMNLMISGGYGKYDLDWNTGVDGKRYEASYRFNYQEIRGTDTVAKSIQNRIATLVASGTSEPMTATIQGEAFFSNLANTIPNDPTVDKRRFTGVEFVFAVANEDFHTYLSLSEPVSGIIEDRPSWSNVEGAYGVFASRYTKVVGGPFEGKRLNDATVNELINGGYTGNRRFCSYFNVGPPYGCD